MRHPLFCACAGPFCKPSGALEARDISLHNPHYECTGATNGTAAAAFSAAADDADEVGGLVLMPEDEPDDEEDIESNADAETARLVARAAI